MTISGDSNRQGNRVRPNLYYVDCDLGKPYRSYTDILMNLCANMEIHFHKW